MRIGKSLYDSKALSQVKPLALKEKVVTPVDWKVKKDMILDIGPITIGLYTAAIKSAKTVVWNGPMGKFEDESFSMGTNALYKAILAQKTANILIGGGDTLEAVAFLAKPRKHIFVSSGGGAMLTYLSGEKLPALEAIK